MATALPADVKYGYVADIIMRAVLDTPADPDDLPDGVPAKGTVTLQPVGTVFTAGGGRTGIVTSPYEFTVHQGLAEKTPGAPVDAQYKGQLVNPATGRTGSHAVVAGWYTVAYKVDGYQKSYGPFHITEEFTEDNPFWIRENIPLEQTPQVKFVINEAILNEVRQIRDSLLEQGVLPGDVVLSVNGKTGDVVLDVDDIPELPTSKIGSGVFHTSRIPPLPQSKVIGLSGSLAEKAALEHTHTVGDIDAAGTPSDATFLRGDGTWAHPPTGGGGAVSSVNGKTGDVVLTADDIMLTEDVPVSVAAGLEAFGQAFEDGLDTKADLYHTHNIEHVNGLEGALEHKANIDDIPEQRVHGGRIFIQETPPTDPEPGDIHLW